MLDQLSRRPAAKLSDSESALKFGLRFLLAAGRADGPGAASCIDIVGYQAIPPDEPLPLPPEKPISAADVSAVISELTPAEVGDLPAEVVAVLNRDQARHDFPAAADWMLPDDHLIRVTPVDPATAGWISRSCHVIVRLRARRPTIVAGSLLECLNVPAATTAAGKGANSSREP